MKSCSSNSFRPGMGPSPEEKARLVQHFRRKAIFTDACLALGLVAILSLTFQDFPLAWPMFCAVIPLLAASAAGIVLTYRRCPFCGRYFRRRDWTMAPSSGVFPAARTVIFPQIGREEIRPDT